MSLVAISLTSSGGERARALVRGWLGGVVVIGSKASSSAAQDASGGEGQKGGGLNLFDSKATSDRQTTGLSRAASVGVVEDVARCRAEDVAK